MCIEGLEKTVHKVGQASNLNKLDKAFLFYGQTEKINAVQKCELTSIEMQKKALVKAADQYTRRFISVTLPQHRNGLQEEILKELCTSNKIIDGIEIIKEFRKTKKDSV